MQTQTTLFRYFLICLLVLSLNVAARADLDAYFRKPEPAYKWSVTRVDKRTDGTVYDLSMTSQTWQNMEWKHRLQVFVPAGIDHPHFCGLLNTGGNGGVQEEMLGMAAAKGSGCVFAVLYNIPNQPLYGGLTEDALIVYTWQKFLETNDESWPLHFPMAKAVLKAMDTIQALARQEKLPSIDGFVITGASKRGWTTWLAGASRDRRIKAIAPMVIDTLNLSKQLPHQLAAYGKPSEQIDDYTRAGILTKLATPGGQRLMQLEDPYSYRKRLTLPKLLILGTNDRYWAQDALNIYWNDLIGPKWVLYTPNSGHGLEDRVRVLNTLSAFIRSIASNRPWPQMEWTYAEGADGTTLTVNSVTSNILPTKVVLFRTYAPTQDFRDSKWTSEPIEPTDMAQSGGAVLLTPDQVGTVARHGVANSIVWSGHLRAPAEGYAAMFGEATYEIDGKSFTLSTQIHIMGKK